MSDEENQPMIDFKALVVDAIREMEREGVDESCSKTSVTKQRLAVTLVPLSSCMESKSAEISYR
jgi:isoamyl acetate esterase